MSLTKALGLAIRLALIVACIFALQSLVATDHWADALAHITSIPISTLVLAIAAVAVSYLALTGYDWLACRYLKTGLGWRAIAPTAATANAVSNMVGFALLSGGAMRLRGYGALGIPAATVAKISLFCTSTFLLGLGLAAALGLAFDGVQFSTLLGLDSIYVQSSGWLIIGLCLTLPIIVQFQRQIRWGSHTIDLPSPSILWAQYGCGLIDIIATGSVLYLMLPGQGSVDFFYFITLFSAALWLGLVSHVPGGIGVFESVMLAGLGGMVSPGEALGAILLYRLIYYGLPFVFALAALLADEAQTVLRAVRLFLRLQDYLLPLILSALAVLAGAALLFSGATPAVGERIDILSGYVPLGLIESSHLLGSVAGLGLLVVARGIYLRLDSAYVTALILLGAGALFSLAKGFDYEEALLLGCIFTIVAASRRAFYRPSKISMLDIGGGWWFVIAITLVATIWLLFFAFQHVEYDHYLWWQVALGAEGDASRSLRSTVLLCVLAFGLGLHQLFRPAIPRLPKPTAEELEHARTLVGAANSTNAFLALTGDKHLLFSPTRDAFIMFGQAGGSLVAMGDPIGNRSVFAALVWQFRELADRHHKRIGFYQISSEFLPLYIDSGMRFARMGEEALVPLTDFSLEGGRFKDLRQSAARAAREDLEFMIVPAQGVTSIEPELRAVSDDWLNTKNVREKAFSMGFYAIDYISHCPVAIVRKNQRIIAFANILATANQAELSVDLMRHAANAPNGTMDFLFAQLLLWGKAQSYRYFNLGMAPLAGFISHRLAPAWTRMGSLLFRHGERFYNFQGVHKFKNKYKPEWRPRYLAYSGLFSLLILFDIAVLIAGGTKGLFRK